MPWVSTARSPDRVGRLPLNAGASNAPGVAATSVIVTPLFDDRAAHTLPSYPEPREAAGIVHDGAPMTAASQAQASGRGTAHECTATALQRVHLAERLSRIRLARRRRRCARGARAALLRRHCPHRGARSDGL